MNEILKDKARKLEDRRFATKERFMIYFTKSMRSEKRNPLEVNNESFRIKANMTLEEQQSVLAERRGERAEQKAEERREEERQRQIMQRASDNPNEVQGFKPTSSLALGMFEKITGSSGPTTELITESTTAIKAENKVVNFPKSAQPQSPKSIKPEGTPAQGTHETQTNPIYLLKRETEEDKLKTQENTTVSIFPSNAWGEIRESIVKDFLAKFGADGGQLEKNWFGRVAAEINEETKEITLTAPNEDTKNWIVANYQNKIESTAKDLGYNLQTIEC